MKGNQQEHTSLMFDLVNQWLFNDTHFIKFHLLEHILKLGFQKDNYIVVHCLSFTESWQIRFKIQSIVNLCINPLTPNSD